MAVRVHSDVSGSCGTWAVEPTLQMSYAVPCSFLQNGRARRLIPRRRIPRSSAMYLGLWPPLCSQCTGGAIRLSSRSVCRSPVRLSIRLPAHLLGLHFTGPPRGCTADKHSGFPNCLPRACRVGDITSLLQGFCLP